MESRVGLGAALVTLFLVFRLLAVSHWDWYTAEVVIESLSFNDALPIMLGTLFARPDLTGIFLAIMLPLALSLVAKPLPGHQRTAASIGAVVVLAAATVALVSTTRSWWVVVVAAAILAVLTLGRRAWRHGWGHQVLQTVLRSTGTIAVVGVLGLAVFVDTPWLPYERFSTENRTFTGYALRVQPGFITVLTDEREIKIMLTGDIKGRKILDDR